MTNLIGLAARLRGFVSDLRQIAAEARDAPSRNAALHLASDLEWRAMCYEHLVLPEAVDTMSVAVH